MPQSASFQNLNATSSSLLGGPPLLSSASSGKIPKNSSSPNLLSDLILGDIISGPAANSNSFAASVNISSAGASASGGSSNPTLSSQSRPNYNRTLFEPPQPVPKQNLNDVFGDILSSQGFAASNRLDGGKTINDMRKIDILSNPNANLTQIKVDSRRFFNLVTLTLYQRFYLGQRLARRQEEEHSRPALLTAYHHVGRVSLGGDKYVANDNARPGQEDLSESMPRHPS